MGNFTWVRAHVTKFSALSFIYTTNLTLFYWGMLISLGLCFVFNFHSLTDYPLKLIQSSVLHHRAAEGHNSACQLLWNCRQDAGCSLSLSGLALFPTPHNTLPSSYAKWRTYKREQMLFFLEMIPPSTGKIVGGWSKCLCKELPKIEIYMLVKPDIFNYCLILSRNAALLSEESNGLTVLAVAKYRSGMMCIFLFDTHNQPRSQGQVHWKIISGHF